MCRLAAYLGPAIPLQQLLLQPSHSLYRQAREPQELIYAKFNADGYGFGWYSDDGQPAVYTSVLPIWADCNLPHLARTLTQPLWLAEIRSATDDSPVNQANTPPFYDNRHVFLHNGLIRDFHTRVRPAMAAMLSPAIAADIRGNTDSEYLFACLRQLQAEQPSGSLPDALRRLCDLLSEWVEDLPALLNMVVSTADRLYAVRHGLNHASPSLYYSTDEEMFPGGQVIASEAFNTDGYWQPVPDHHILVLDPQAPPDLVEL